MPNQSLIRTKLIPPLPRPDLVKRTRLSGDLPSLRKLTLLAAPAGFGKSTLMAQWYRLLQARGRKCLWISLDYDDRHLTRFLRYLLAATASIAPDLGAELQRRLDTAVSRDFASLLPDLVNGLAEIGPKIVIFIDDFHFANNPEVSQFVELFIDLSPPNVHLVIASRVRPPLPLASLRVRGAVFEVTANHLRFDSNEASEFFKSVNGIELTDRQLARLHDHSEGWAAGLRLAAMSLREADRRDSIIESFSGNFRDIADYLAADVLEQQPDEVQLFLLLTSVLNRFNAEVCHVLTGQSDAGSILDYLEDNNLFVSSLDHERKWYRYHHLFHEFLLGQLRRRYPEKIVSLYGQAARWFSDKGFTSEAVDYALLSGNMSLAVELVTDQVDAEMMAGRMPRVNDWVDRIPEDLCRAHPELLLAKATALYHMNRAQEADATVAILESVDEAGRLPQKKRDELQIVKAGIHMCRDEIDRILAPLQRISGKPNHFNTGVMNNIRGFALAEANLFDEAEQAITMARRAHSASSSTFGVVYSDCFQGYIDLARGNLVACFARFEDSTGSNKRVDTFVGVVPVIMKSVVLYEWNRLSEAEAALEKSLRLAEQVGHIKLITLGYLTLAKLASAHGEHGTAARYFEYLLNIGRDRGTSPDRLRAQVAAERVRDLLTRSRVDDAARAAQAAGIDPAGPLPNCPSQWELVSCLNQTTLARMLIATGKAGTALSFIPALIELAGASMRRGAMLECQLMLCLAQLELGEKDDARRTLTAALQSNAENRPLRRFLDQGPGLRAFLQAQRSVIARDLDDTERDFLLAILAACNEAQSGPALGKMAPGGDPDAFSQREVEVLQLLAAGQSNPDIAHQLFISENTVKWHIKNIFSKLGVNNRTAAVVAAQQRHLVA